MADTPAVEKLVDPRVATAAAPTAAPVAKGPITPDLPGHLVIQLPQAAEAATQALNVGEGRGFVFEAVYVSNGAAFAVMVRKP